VTQREILSRAESADEPEYDALRQRFLDGCSGKVPRVRPANWKQAVLLNAWHERLKDPALCSELWNFQPTGNGMRNPFPGMERDTLEFFAARGQQGILIGMEALLKRAQHYAGLCAYVRDQNSAYAFETILDVAACNRNYVAPELLASFGKSRAPEITSAISAATRGRVQFLVYALKLLDYRKSAPVLGECLLKIPKGHSKLISDDEYWHEEEYLGLAIADTFEQFTDVKFYGNKMDSGSMIRREAARRIDEAIAWWKKSGCRRKWN
jgi:hypothetical protein